MKRISILGSTGSIGRSTLSVVESYPERFEIVALAAGRNVDAAFEQAKQWRPKLVSVAAEADAEILRARLGAAGVGGVEVVHGPAGSVQVATHPETDFVVSAIVGVAGLEATYEAVRAGKTVGLANKECLVAAGELITAEARRQGKPLLPIDSEHNAVHQCLRGGRMEEVERIWLTASGGPFLHTPKSQFSSITVEQGFRGHRSLPFVQPAARASASNRASPIHHSFDGRIRGWQHTCSVLGDRYAAAHPLCADLSGAH
jgi:1-deoxy-D-xylulose-5-phosphate reductoisomerase